MRGLPTKYRLLVIGPYPPPLAGPEMAIKNLLESPIQERFDIVHMSTNVRAANTDKGRVGLPLIKAFFVFLWRLISALIKHRPHAVYYFVTATRMGWLGRDVWCIAVSKLFGARVAIHMRAGHFRHRLEGAGKFTMAVIGWACRKADLALVQAPSLRDQFEGLARPEAIQVVPNMIDVSKYGAVDPDDCERGNALFLGHISTAKGYCELLKAIPVLAEKHPHARFHCAGEKRDKERNVHHVQTTGEALPDEHPDRALEALEETGFGDRHIYEGVLKEPEKIAALRRAEIFILPSFSEGFSMAILEAMSMGKPVVCSRVGAMRDFVIDGENGMTFEPGDTEGLINAVDQLLSDRALRDRIAHNNALYVRKFFSQTAVAQTLGDFIEGTLTRR